MKLLKIAILTLITNFTINSIAIAEDGEEVKLLVEIADSYEETNYALRMKLLELIEKIRLNSVQIATLKLYFLSGGFVAANSEKCSSELLHSKMILKDLDSLSRHVPSENMTEIELSYMKGREDGANAECEINSTENVYNEFNIRAEGYIAIFLAKLAAHSKFMALVRN